MSTLYQRVPTAPIWFFECELCQLWHEQCPQHLENCEKAAKGGDVWKVAGPFFANFHFEDKHFHYWPGNKRPPQVLMLHRRRHRPPDNERVAVAVAEKSALSPKPIPAYLLDDYIKARRAQRKEFWKKKSAA